MRFLQASVFLLALVATIGCQDDGFTPSNNRGNNGDNNGSNNFIPAGKGVGAECEGEQCREGLTCTDNVCAFTGDSAEGTPCRLTGECAEGLYCNALTTVCESAGEAAEGEGCGNLADCSAGLVCRPRGLAGSCVAGGTSDIGAACESTQDCYAGLNCKADPITPENGQVCLAGPIGFPTPWPGVECAEDDTESFRPYFELPDENTTEFYRLPFPNDIRMGSNGRPDLSGHPTPGNGILGFDIVQTYVDAIEADQLGWGLNHTVLFRFSQPVAFNTITASGDSRNVLYVNIDPDSSNYDRRRGLRWNYSSGKKKYMCQNQVGVRNLWGDPLQPNTTYAVVLLNSILSEAGTNAVADTSFSMLVGDARPDGAAGEAWDKYAALRAWLADANVTAPVANSIISAAVFTTGNPIGESQVLTAPARLAAAQESELTLCEAATTSPCDDGLSGDEHTRGCMGVDPAFKEIHGKLSLPVFQEGTPPYLETGGKITTSVQRSEDVCMAMTVPENALMPAEGWPVILYAHGTGGTFRSGLRDIGAAVSSIDIDGTPVNFVTVGWDQVLHHTRRGDSDIHPNQLVYNYANPNAAKGNFLQGAAEIHSIVAWLETLEIAGATSPSSEDIKIDPTKIYFMGHSQGGTTGPIALPFDQSVSGALLSGAGAGLSLALLGKTSPVNSPAAMQFVLQESSAVGTAHPVISLLQGYFDPVDPLNYAAALAVNPIEGVTYPHHVFQTNGIGDTFTPPSALNTLAIALRATYVGTQAEPIDRVPVGALPFSGNITHDALPYTVVGRQYEADGYDGHFVVFRNPTAQTDLINFFGTGAALGLPELR